VKDIRVLIIGAYRPEELETFGEKHPLLETVQRLKREKIVTMVTLDRLDQEASGKIISSMLEIESPEELTKLVFQETEGNPYFIEEVIKSIVDGNAIDTESGEVEFDIKQIKIPSSVHDLIQRRIEQLSEEERKILDYAAVIGPEFDYDLLLEGTKIDEEMLVESLDKLMDLKLIAEIPSAAGTNYRFTHNMAREVIYNNLSRTKRRLMHKKVGESLENMSSGRADQNIFALSYHFSQTSDMGKAFNYSVQAGNISMRAFAFHEARNYLESSLDILPKLEDVENAVAKEIEILNKLGDVSNILGDWMKALNYHYEALKLCDDNTAEKARAFRAIGEVERERNEWRTAIESFEKSKEICEKIGDSRGLAESFRGLAWISWKAGDHEKVLQYANRTIEEAKKVGDNALVGKALIDIGNSYNELQDNYDKALDYYEDALTMFDTKKDLDQISRAYNNLGDVYMKKTEYDKAIEYFEKCLDIVKVTGDLNLKGFGIANIGECRIRMGQPEHAPDYIDRALKIFEKVDNKYMIAQMYNYKAQIARHAKEYDTSDALFKIAVKIQEEHNLPWGLANTLLEYGIMIKEKGDKERAREHLQRSLDLFTQLGSSTLIEIVKMEMED
jgi:predicted ATPase